MLTATNSTIEFFSPTSGFEYIQNRCIFHSFDHKGVRECIKDLLKDPVPILKDVILDMPMSAISVLLDVDKLDGYVDIQIPFTILVVFEDPVNKK